jgi:Skp family chaperone for outer membrane proteins
MTLKQFGIGFLALLALGSAPLTGIAQDGEKYGFVNISLVITQSEEGQAEAKELESLGAAKERALLERQQELQALAKQFEEGANSGQPDEELKERVERLQRELERDARQAQSDVDVSRQDRIQAIGSKAVEVVRKFAEANDYTAIFRIDGGQIVYVDPDVDLTQQIIEAYDKAHPVQ